MKPFEFYFSETQLVKILCKQRAIQAKKRNDLKFIYNLSDFAKPPDTVAWQSLAGMFPPRERWIRPKYGERKRYSNTFELNIESLRRTIERSKSLSRRSSSLPSYTEMTRFIAEIQDRAMHQVGEPIQPPKVHPLAKDPTKKSFRPIAVYPLADRIIISQVAKYLVDAFDRDFLDYSFAFRSTRARERCPTHHDSIRALIEFRRNHSSRSLWVAECDIIKFYDCVNHTVALSALQKALDRAEARGVVVDKRALLLFRQYLDSYSFNNYVKAKEEQWFASSGVASGSFDTPPETALISAYTTLPKEPIGVPQGGAISCLIANLILDDVDRSVVGSTKPDKNLFYARYCDDMILLHRSKHKCVEAFDRYQSGLKKNLLFCHPPAKRAEYNRDFWSHKSKEPYLWGAKIDRAVPWLSFVGYQLRYDGLLRIRPKSIGKELKKQAEETNKVLQILRIRRLQQTGEGHIKKSSGQIAFRLQQRLISMSVGRIKNTSLSPSRSEFCWAAGFRALDGNRIVNSQLKRLDKGRELQLSRLRKRIASITKTADRSIAAVEVERFYGYPFSYFGRLGNRADLPAASAETLLSKSCRAIVFRFLPNNIVSFVCSALRCIVAKFHKLRLLVRREN